MIQYVLESGDVGGAVEENKGEKGGWAEQCPTEGGTDEVREKWREKREEELRKGTHKEQKRGHFLSQKQSHRREITFTPEFQEQVLDRDMEVKRCTRCRGKIHVECDEEHKHSEHSYTAGCVSHCSGMCAHSWTTMTSPC